ncbi:hypothetical protein RvY_16495 [Ramazzottius varieornatus]|uniref:UDENN domain-containing protein n=1 Tax=Ramazzottius varieornatus TaxID=947166 RepID=A0A1D1VYP0_RAMVA|nr:hypothetical protein RvY_16495 [Ramazzottius varieornatus]
MAESSNVISHVLVIGFHHKKGCQLEYCYPPFPTPPWQLTRTTEGTTGDTLQEVKLEGDTPELMLPEEWKHLPSLALPDGAHKYQSDTVYFHLPSLDDDSKTAFGVSCYRQIDADKLLKKDLEVTRETVQKSVCVVSRLPLYGIIEAKLALITHAYFEERDFSQVQLLEDTYNQLNESLSEKLLQESQIFVGLSVRDLVVRFKHRILVLFKLLLLEKKVLVYSSPVKLLSSSIISLISLFPEMVEYGLTQSACMNQLQDSQDSAILDDKPILEYISEMDLLEEINRELTYRDTDDESLESKSHDSAKDKKPEEEEDLPPSISSESSEDDPSVKSSTPLSSVPVSASNSTEQTNGQNRRASSTKMQPVRPSLNRKDEYGFPLEVFTKGYICHPYLSLAYYDLLNDPAIPGFFIGATNQLFLHHHKKFADALVDVAEGKVEVYDVDLKRQLQLTTEDIRFIDNVVKMVNDDANGAKAESVFHGTGWEGGEEWIRSQFRAYLTGMLGTASRCSALDKSQKLVLESFNYSFVSAWRKTKNFRIWNENAPTKLEDFAMGHPCSGEYSVADIKAKVNSMLTPERSKKLSAAVHAVNETSKMVQQNAKSWVSSWISGIRKDS